MKKLAVLGGSFDPVHNAHVLMAKFAVKEFCLDKIIFVPAYKPPHKDNLSACAAARYDMLKLALEQYPEFDVDTYELNLKREVFSYQMLDYFKTKYNDCSIKMIIGSDSFNQLENWRKTEYICKNYGFYVLQRPDAGINEASPYYKYCEFSKAVMPPTSSTEVRKRIRNGEDISLFVDKKVAEYIKEKKLYLL